MGSINLESIPFTMTGVERKNFKEATKKKTFDQIYQEKQKLLKGKEGSEFALTHKILTAHTAR